MTFASQLELPGSPFEQASQASETYYWNPSTTGDLETGEVVSAPVCQVYEYDVRYGQDESDVTATVVVAGSPFVGSGAFANQVGVTIASLTIGYEYRVQLRFTGNVAHVPERYFRLRCQF